MASKRQVAANGLNARLSTGPKTQDGKAQSSRNAITHGLTASRCLFPGESAEEYQQMREALIAELMPEGALECEVAERIAPSRLRTDWQICPCQRTITLCVLQYVAHRV